MPTCSGRSTANPPPQANTGLRLGARSITGLVFDDIDPSVRGDFVEPPQHHCNPDAALPFRTNLAQLQLHEGVKITPCLNPLPSPSERARVPRRCLAAPPHHGQRPLFIIEPRIGLV